MSRARPDRLTLEEAAARLGVHYMTAYRYVRLGRLAASLEDGRWWVEPEALAAVAAPAPTRPPTSGVRWAAWRKRLLSRLSAGDVAGAWSIVEGALAAGRPTVDLYVHLFGPVMRQIGDEWEAGARSVQSEHRASAVALRLVGRIGAGGLRPGPRRRATVVLGGAPGDPHQLPPLMVADALRWEGFQVVDLGADVPAASFVEAARVAPELAAIGVSLSVERHRAAVAELLAQLRREAPPARLLVGGPVVGDEDSARALGADGWASHAGSVGEVVGATS